MASVLDLHMGWLLSNGLGVLGFISLLCLLLCQLSFDFLLGLLDKMMLLSVLLLLCGGQEICVVVLSSSVESPVYLVFICGEHSIGDGPLVDCMG